MYTRNYCLYSSSFYFIQFVLIGYYDIVLFSVPILFLYL